MSARNLWTPTEDRQLREMASAGFSAAEIAKKLGRRPRSIQGHASTLGIRLASQALRFRTFARGERDKIK